MIKSAIRKALASSGRRIVKEKGIPFGVDLQLDLRRVMNRSVRTIFDVGGNEGQTVRRFSKLWPDSRIESFEPTPDVFPLLEQVCKDYSWANPHKTALGKQHEKIPFYCYDQTQSNSFIKNPDLPVKKIEDVEVETLDRWCIRQKIDQIDLLKIDVEGAEIDVLAGANRMLSEGRISSVLAEVSLYPDDQSHTFFEEIRKTLAPHGFYFITLNGQFNRIDNHQFVYADALFVHRSSVAHTGRKAVMPVDCVGMSVS